MASALTKHDYTTLSPVRIQNQISQTRHIWIHKHPHSLVSSQLYNRFKKWIWISPNKSRIKQFCKVTWRNISIRYWLSRLKVTLGKEPLTGQLFSMSKGSELRVKGWQANLQYLQYSEQSVTPTNVSMIANMLTLFSLYPGGHSQKNWVGMCGPHYKTLTLFTTWTLHQNPISDLRYNWIPSSNPC